MDEVSGPDECDGAEYIVKGFRRYGLPDGMWETSWHHGSQRVLQNAAKTQVQALDHLGMYHSL